MEKLNGQYFVAVAVFCLVATFTSAATVASVTCTQGTECKAIANSTCDGSHCKCDAAFKEGTSPAEGTCVPKVLEDPCTAGANAECANVTHAECRKTDNKCGCPVQYKAASGACTLRALEDSCTAGADAECAGVTHAECRKRDNKCGCPVQYKTVNGACTLRALEDSCTAAANAECAGVTHAECRAADNKCGCPVQYNTVSGACTPKGLNDTCTADTECSAVPNAGCVGTSSKVCTCKENFKTDNGLCSSANGLQTLLSAPVAVMLSFLTIVITTLH